jgi:hypothetical protein
MAGCGNHGCWIEKPKGQGTNGRCHCLSVLGKENEHFIKMKMERLAQYEHTLQIIAAGKPGWDNVLPEAERDFMKMIAKICLDGG